MNYNVHNVQDLQKCRENIKMLFEDLETNYIDERGKTRKLSINSVQELFYKMQIRK